MYLKHFELDSYPFRLSPDPDFLFRSQGYALARAYIEYSLMSRDGMVVITGDVGAGKTTLLRKLLQDHMEDALVIHVEQTQLDPTEFLQLVCQKLTATPCTATKPAVLEDISQALLRRASTRRRVVLCVDEAQSLSFEVLEEIRFLTALEWDKEPLLSVILLGQPELRHVLEAPRMEQLRQRVRLHYHLAGLDEEEVSAYVLHRLGVAGARQPGRLLAADSWAEIHRYTGGIPRLINTLCDRAFLRALLAGKRLIRGAGIVEAAAELGWPPYGQRKATGDGGRPRGIPGQASDALDGADAAQAMERLERRLQGLETQLARIADSLAPADHADASRPRRREAS